MIELRQVHAEWLDSLAPGDPLAIASRRDIRRINRLIATHALLRAPLDRILCGATSNRIVELGAGEGLTLLQLARHHGRNWPKVRLELLDMQPVVSARTLAGYRDLGWDVEVIRADVFDWLARPASGAAPVIVANLFMHHFEGERLRALLQGIAARASAFLCCEPRRSRTALAFSRLLGVIGCNEITRHDAMVSVRAGFNAQELSALWPHPDAWILRECAAGLFSHRFLAEAKRL